ncbi:MAG: TetR/AcrR family transcriptional regulator [Pseudomonadota bacterium]
MKKDRRIVQSENAILEAGIQTLLDNPTAGMSEVAVNAGVGRTTLYRHFETKEALIRAIVLYCFDEIDEALKPIEALSGRAAIEATIELLIPVADRYRVLSRLWSVVSNDVAVLARIEQSTRDVDWLMEQGVERGVLDGDLPASWLTQQFEMTLYGAWDLLDRQQITVEEAIRCAQQSFFRGVQAQR